MGAGQGPISRLSGTLSFMGDDDRSAVFGVLPANVRAEIMTILGDETASGYLHCSDDGIDMRYGAGLWRASIWRRSDGKNMLAIECRRGIGTRWQVLIAPANRVDSMFVLRWPDPGFEAALRAAVDSLRTSRPG